MEKLKIAQVGVGHYGSVRRKLIRATGAFEMLSCYDFNEKAMKATFEEDGAKPASSYEDLLDTPGIEAMIISTGASYHAEQIIAALDKGLHVYVEKPLCSSPAELEGIVAAQKRSGLVVGVGHFDHYNDPVADYTKQAIDSGDLGDLVGFEVTTAHSGGQLIKEGDWRGDPDKNPGGMLFQCGVHKIHELMHFLGPIVKVQCSMNYDVNKKTKTADSAHCILQCASGICGTLNAYHITAFRHRFDILGTKANLYRENRYFDEGITLLKQTVRPGGGKEEQERIDIDGLYAGKQLSPHSMQSFYDAIRNGGEVYPSLSNGATAVAVVFAAEESAKTGREVKIKL